MDERRADVVIVGGGIAGGALAVRLARAGLAVTVLEQSEQFRDRVRGETMFPWGYAELAKSDLLDIEPFPVAGGLAGQAGHADGGQMTGDDAGPR